MDASVFVFAHFPSRVRFARSGVWIQISWTWFSSNLVSDRTETLGTLRNAGRSSNSHWELSLRTLTENSHRTLNDQCVLPNAKLSTSLNSVESVNLCSFCLSSFIVGFRAGFFAIRTKFEQIQTNSTNFFRPTSWSGHRTTGPNCGQLCGLYVSWIQRCQRCLVILVGLVIFVDLVIISGDIFLRSSVNFKIKRLWKVWSSMWSVCCRFRCIFVQSHRWSNRSSYRVRKLAFRQNGCDDRCLNEWKRS